MIRISWLGGGQSQQSPWGSQLGRGRSLHNVFLLKRLEKLNVQRKIQTATMVYKCLNGLATEYLRSKTVRASWLFHCLPPTNLVPRVSLSLPPRALGGGERETLGTRLPTNFLKNRFSYSTVVWCSGIPYLSGCGKHKLSLASNPAAAVSLFIMANHSQYTAFMESRDPFAHIIVIN